MNAKAKIVGEKICHVLGVLILLFCITWFVCFFIGYQWTKPFSAFICGILALPIGLMTYITGSTIINPPRED